ncbi:MAG: hypothetical protein ACE5KZ_10480 [Candidatus Scalinduaceae bacterium]
MVNTNTTIVRKLKHDITQKNTTRKEIERHINAIRIWKDKLVNSKSFQKQKRYIASIKRYLAKIEQLRARLNQMNECLENSIREMGKHSTSEIEAFQQQLDKEIRDIEADMNPKKTEKSHSKEIKEIKNARKKLAELKGKGNLQKKIEKINKQLSDDIADVEQVTGKILKLNSRLGKVSKGTEPEKKELPSEEKDNKMFTQELKRIARERVIFS